MVCKVVVQTREVALLQYAALVDGGEFYSHRQMWTNRHIPARWCEKRDLVPAVLIRFAPLSLSNCTLS